MIAFDTNIAIYILNNHPQFYLQSESVINQAKLEGGCISVLLISELLSFPGFSNSNQIVLVENFIESLLPIVACAIDDTVARQAAVLRRNHKSLKLPDAIHLASAVQNGASEFWTNDHQLAKVLILGLQIKLLNTATN